MWLLGTQFQELFSLHSANSSQNHLMNSHQLPSGYWWPSSICPDEMCLWGVRSIRSLLGMFILNIINSLVCLGTSLFPTVSSRFFYINKCLHNPASFSSQKPLSISLSQYSPISNKIIKLWPFKLLDIFHIC